MSDECCNGPTYTSLNGLYNATQVRLYGRPAIDFPIHIPPVHPKKAKAEKKSGSDVFSLLAALNGKLPDNPSSLLPVQTSWQEYVLLCWVMSSARDEATPILTAGMIFGYAYEGHCYDLPKPRLMVIPAIPQNIPDGDCGYDLKGKATPTDTLYKVWIVDKLDRCIDIDVSQGYVEELVLEANLPGKRAPTMYAAKARLAHRSGRLTD